MRTLRDLSGLAQGLALLTGADLAQEIPGIDAQFMAIVPAEANGVLAHRFSVYRLGCGFEHGQRTRGKLRRFARFAPGFGPILVAQGTRARIPQVSKRVT